MTKSRSRVALERFGRIVAAGAIAAAVSALPAVFADVPAEYAFLAVPALTAILAALDKARRYVAPEDVA